MGKEDCALNMEQRVLIIDSDKANCKVIKYALAEYGIGAYYTLSVVDGIERLLRHNYQLVILDISLSETEGLQLIRFMRQMKDMPILALSSQGGIESRERAFHMGADDFMEKPLELRECLVRAQALLRRYNAAAPPLPGQRRYTIVNLANLLVDPMTRRTLQQEVRTLQQKLNKTFVFVTHDMAEALDLADVIIFMDHGRIVQMPPRRRCSPTPQADRSRTF